VGGGRGSVHLVGGGAGPEREKEEKSFWHSELRSWGGGGYVVRKSTNINFARGRLQIERIHLSKNENG